MAITNVNLDNVEIKRLPINIFKGMPHLKSVTFHWVAGIYELPEDLFENNLELEYFYMSTSGFSGGATMADVLPAKFLQNKPNLQKVRFLNTRIKAIPNEAFSGANHLTSLELSWNPFLTVGSYICRGCNSLTSISFLGGSINHVSIDAFAEMPNLVAVDLRQNNLSLLEQEALIKAYPKIRFDFKFQR